MDTATLLERVRRIEIKTRGMSKQLFSGEYHSAFKGRGMSFSEVRSYTPGDDVRSIDWNVTARTGEPHIKIYEEERELTVMLVVDVSRSVFFGSGNRLKKDVMTEICAVLSFSAIQNNDKVGLILFTDHVELFIPPKKGRTHILRIIRELVNFEASHERTNIRSSLQFFNNVIKKRSICFLASDFYADGYETPLRVAARRHDLVGLHLYDSLERSVPAMGLVVGVDAETGRNVYLDSGSRETAQRLAESFESRTSGLDSLFYKSGAEMVHLNSNRPYIPVLLQFFKNRARV